MSLHIGTSGWAYPEWRPAFYPAGLPQDDFLIHYASILGGCEINATAYRLPSAAAVGRWAAQTPPGFRFAVKAHRRLTEAAAPGEHAWHDFLTRFLESLAPLGERFGCLLIPLPDEHPRDDDLLTAMMDALPPDIPFACNLRHPSWRGADVDAAIASAGGTRCFEETDGEPAPTAFPAGPLAYVRLRAERYEDDARDSWAEALAREARARPVLAFARHKDLPAGDPAAGIGLAEWLAAATA